MAQVIHENIIQFQEGNDVPYCALYCEFKLFGLVFDVSKYVKTNPEIEDAADYQENVTRLNEIAITFDGTDGVIKNFLDTDEEIEVFLYRYYDVPNGKENKLKKFGGFIDKSRIKWNDTIAEPEVTIVPYYGKSERTGLRLSRKYTDENGLKLNNCEVWLKRANIDGHILKNGVHEISVKHEGGFPYAKLDDGEWTALGSGFTTILDTAEDVFGDFQQCEIFYISFSFEAGEERSQKIIVKEEGQQYPDTFYFYPSVKELIVKAFNEMDITDYKFDRFLIPTFDGRRVISGTSRVDNDINNTFIPIAIVSNGTDKIYISGSTGALTTPFKNQIWEYNHVTNEVRLIYETTLNINTKYKLIWDDGHLIAFIDNKEEDEERGFIQYFTFGELGIAYSTVLMDAQFNDTNPYYSFHYSKFLKSFIYLGFTGGNKTITAVHVQTGTKTTILTDNAIELLGFNFVWDNETVVEFYYLKRFAGGSRNVRMMKVEFQNGWQAPEEVCDWFDNDNYNNFYGHQFIFEGKIFIQNYERTEARFFDIAKAEFSENVCPEDVKIYSPIEIFEKLYFIQLDEDKEQKICYFSDEEITIVSFKKITPYDLVFTPGIYAFQQLTEFTDINELQVIGALSKTPALLLKFADNIEPFIEGELDTEDETIRDIIEEIANNYLAWVRVDYNNKGFWVKRSSYNSNDILTFKKKYTAEKTTDIAYNEVYDGVEITNGNGVKYSWGETGINSKVLRLNLRFIPDDFVIDVCKYYYDYYSVQRRLHKFNGIPTYFNYEVFDKADLSEYGLGQGIIHTVRPNATRAEFEVLL